MLTTKDKSDLSPRFLTFYLLEEEICDQLWSRREKLFVFQHRSPAFFPDNLYVKYFNCCYNHTELDEVFSRT